MAKDNNLDTLMSAKDLDKFIGKLTFEAGNELLEELVSQIEAGKMPLDQTVAAYERAAILLQHLRSLLNQAEQKMQVINQRSKS